MVFHRVKHAAKRAAHKIKHIQESSAKRALLEEFFQDYYKHRTEVYKVNFVRGIVFGLGSALGGTIILAIVIWLFFQIPGVQDFVREAQQTVQDSQR